MGHALGSANDPPIDPEFVFLLPTVVAAALPLIARERDPSRVCPVRDGFGLPFSRLPAVLALLSHRNPAILVRPSLSGWSLCLERCICCTVLRGPILTLRHRAADAIRGVVHV